jgi:transposase-like protein
MPRRQWDAKTKARIVRQGLQGKPVAELCHESQISQSLYYPWRGQFLAHVDKAFEVHQHARKEAHLARENARLKGLVGELLLELKKSDELLG